MEINNLISSGLLELYVLGLSSENENSEIINLSKQNPEVASELEAIETCLENYAMLYAVKPGIDVKNKVLNKINSTIHTSTQTGKIINLSFWKNAAAAAILFLIGSAIFNFVYFNKYQKANKDYAAAVFEKNNLQDQLTDAKKSNDEMKNDMGVIQSKYSEPISLHGLAAAPDAAAKIFWMKNTGEVYLDPSNLPEAPAGMQYQLWGIVDGKPLDAGLIISTKKGDKYRIQKMKTFGKVDAFAVTLETEGGNLTPKGDMYVMGEM